MAPVIQSVLVFFTAGLFEIGGGYLVWQWIHTGQPFAMEIAHAGAPHGGLPLPDGHLHRRLMLNRRLPSKGTRDSQSTAVAPNPGPYVHYMPTRYLLACARKYIHEYASPDDVLSTYQS